MSNDSQNFEAPLLVREGESVAGLPIHFIGNQMWVKLLSESVVGQFSMMENAIAAHNGPPLHAHPFEEFFYILKGEFLFELDGKPIRATAGDFLHILGMVPHVFQNTSGDEGRVLLLARSGGVEKYFTELGRHAISNPGDLAALNALGLPYGITILGPPIAARKTPVPMS